MITEKAQEKVQAITNFTAPTGAGTAAAGMLTFNEWLALGGFILALGSFLEFFYINQRANRHHHPRIKRSNSSGIELFVHHRFFRDQWHQESSPR